MEKMKQRFLKIAFTGPECSGKTTLALWLSEQLALPFVEEYAREYLSNMERYSWEDVQNIGRQQFAMNHTSIHCVCDTEMTVIRIWEKVRFGSISEGTQSLSLNDNYDLLFLCKPDFEWHPDPLREHPHERNLLFELYVQDLQIRGLPFHLLSGNIKERKEQILAIISRRIP